MQGRDGDHRDKGLKECSTAHWGRRVLLMRAAPQVRSTDAEGGVQLQRGSRVA